MSATSARRSKEPNGVVSVASKPSKPLTPVPTAGDGKDCSLSGRVKTRPASHPVTRSERPAGVCRWSAASVPRGRSPSPSEFSRDRSRVSAEKSASRAGKSVPRVRVSDSDRNRKVSEENGRSKSVARVSVSRVRKEDIGNGGVASGVKESKYPSKLHEKLAFLEGKVKRIATDIKKTKEMLDQNNPDASKVILLGIQEKITGIEAAMGCVGGDSKTAEKVDCTGKRSVNGMNSEELEARLFPHHKLLRNRTAAVKVPSEKSGEEPDTGARSIDANPIAVEFLASMSKDQGCEHEDEEAEDADFEEAKENATVSVRRNDGVEINLTTDERLEDLEDKRKTSQGVNFEEEIVDNFIEQVDEIGSKMSTCGWFVSEGESVLLAHSDGSCSLYDVVNNDEKIVYKAPLGTSPNMWRDCWVIRAPRADGSPGRYVVAASTGSSIDSGFCSWDYYSKEVRAFRFEKGKTPSSRTALGPLPNNSRNPLSSIANAEAGQWWCKPCGALVAVTSGWQKAVKVFDVRDGEKIMNWNVSSPVLRMDFSSPLQWRNMGKVVVGEMEAVSLWDVSSISSQALLSVPSCGRIISAFHINNSDAELGGGVRQRLSSSEAEGNDGVFCTQDAISVLDFRLPNGVALKIPKLGVTAQSVFSRGDSVFLGCFNTRQGKRQSPAEIQQFSLRKQRLVCSYPIPECYDVAITQVWGNSNHVMGVCGLGLFVFDALRDNDMPCFKAQEGNTNTQCVREITGPDNMYLPSFDYATGRALIISRDRPAMVKPLL